MSAESLPITSTRFAKALEDLPLSALYGKVAEIRNSIAHLQKSNNELEEYARQEDDKDCYEALLENREVIQRMEERIELVKREVTEVRGLMWEPEGENKEREREDQAGRPTNETGTDVRMRDAGSTNVTNTTATTNGTAQEQSNGAASAQEEEGVFL